MAHSVLTHPHVHDAFFIHFFVSEWIWGEKLSCHICTLQHSFLFFWTTQNDRRFLSEIFQRFKSQRQVTDLEAAAEEQCAVVGLLQEMCNLSKVLQIEARNRFLRTLYEHEIMTIFEEAIRNPKVKTRISALDILNTCAIHDCSFVRTYILQQEPTYGLMMELIKRVLEDSDMGVKGHASEIIRRLVDPDSMEQSQEKNFFMNIFYEKFVEKLIAIYNPDYACGQSL
jgi:protein phosphatase-4 regulatory subunit 3